MLNRRFEPLGETTLARVHLLSESQLGDLAVAVLDFAGVADLDDWLAGRSA